LLTGSSERGRFFGRCALDAAVLAHASQGALKCTPQPPRGGDDFVARLEMKALVVGDVKISTRVQKDTSKLISGNYQAGWDLKVDCFVKQATKARRGVPAGLTPSRMRPLRASQKKLQRALWRRLAAPLTARAARASQGVKGPPWGAWG